MIPDDVPFASIVDSILVDTGFADQRAAKMDIDDLLKCVAAVRVRDKTSGGTDLAHHDCFCDLQASDRVQREGYPLCLGRPSSPAHLRLLSFLAPPFFSRPSWISCSLLHLFSIVRAI